MRKAILFLVILASSVLLFSSDLSFSGGKSSLSLKDGKEEVVLSEGAHVTVDDLVIDSERITLKGEGWTEVTCSGKTVIVDKKNNIEIRTSSLWFDRTEERMLISSWYEIDDMKNEISATGSLMEFDMKTGIITLDKDITLLKITEDGIMRCKAESVIFDRESQSLSLRGNASVIWNGDEYYAEVISVNLENDTISLEGRIKGTING